jgi:hypothetical protein
LPWIDGGCALLAGVVVLLLRDLLVDFYGLPMALLTTIGVVNILYSGFGLTLVSRRPRPPVVLKALVVANMAWAVVCVVLATQVADRASVFGLAHILGEGVFVTGLAALEWRHRRAILGSAGTGSG